MKRFGALDLVLLGTLVPLWIVCTSLHSYRWLGVGLGWPDLYVTTPATPEDYPTLRGSETEDLLQQAKLAVGDQLIRVGRVDLRGVGPLGFAPRILEATGPDRRVAIDYVRDGVPGTTWFEIPPLLFQWRYLPLTFSFAATGILVLLKAPGTRSARALFAACVIYSLLWLRAGVAPRMQTYVWVVTATSAAALAPPLLLRAAFLLPEEVAPANRWAFVWPWAFALVAPGYFSWFLGVPLTPRDGLRLGLVVWTAFGVALLGVLTRNYRKSGPVGRRRLKWVVYGLYIGSVPVIAADAVAAFEPNLWWLSSACSITLTLIPLCMLIAIVRCNLYDIDRVISATAAYTLLLVVLLAAAFTIIPSVSRVASAFVGIDHSSSQLMLSLAVAALVVPGQRRVRPWIERVFFSERYALERGIEGLLRQLSAAESPRALLTLAGEQLHALLRPASCAIYGRVGDVYAPLFAQGACAPAVGEHGWLVAGLRGGRRPASVDTLRRTHTGQGRSGSDRAPAEIVGASVVVPVMRDESLVAFVSLGAKRSGDVYTTTDLALLAALADKVAAELLRFDEAEVLQQERAMVQALRSYVPAPVVERIEEGGSLDAARREVSVLFVDIRGYTSYSEGRQAEEVFSTINRYTETVSQVVRRHGGTVVEFTGDGVMAVFGAPKELANKERAATAAGRDIVEVVRALVVDGQAQPFSVGVGIATGEAVVGTIHSADHLIWTAIGNTPNLAARLQALTREVGASIVIDEPTRTKAASVAEDFERRTGIPIRGRREPLPVYFLPLDRPIDLRDHGR